MKRLVFVPVLGVLGLAMASPASAQLAGRTDWNNPAYADERQPYNESRRVAYDNGYREGLKEGEHDGRRRESFNFEDEKTWQHADKGYHRTYGDWNRYQQSFRSGFASGYTDAYRRYAPAGYNNGYGTPYPNTRGSSGYPQGGYGYPQGGYPQGNYPQGGYGYPRGGYGSPRGSAYSPGYSNGVNDGYEKGREDGKDHDSYDPLRHKWYRSGDHDYKSSYGPKQYYADAYRQGFQEGYERGYREWSYRR